MLLSNIDGHIHALTHDFDGDWLAVVLVLHKESELLADVTQLEGHKSEVNANLGVGADFIGALELHLSKEFFIGVILEDDLLTSCSLTLELLTHLCRGFLLEGYVFLGSVFIAVNDFLLVYRHGVKNAVVPCVDIFNLLSKFLLVYEGYLPSILGFNIHLGGKSTIILNPDLPQCLLTEDHLTEVHSSLFRPLQVDQSLLAGADQRQIDGSCLREQVQGAVNILVQLWCKGNGYGCGETSTHASRRSVLNVEEVLD